MKQKNNIIKNMAIYIMLTVIAAITFLPVMYAIFGSFRTSSEIFVMPEKLFPEKFTFENYIEAFNSDVFNVKLMTLNSLKYTLIVVISSLIFSSMAGYAFAWGDFPFKKLIFTVFTALLFIDMAGITVYPLFDVLNILHLNQSLWGLMVIKIFSVNIVQMYLFKSYVSTLPKALFEAAKIDGCNVIQTYWKVIAPLLLPVFATCAILSFQSSWNEYLLPQIFTSSTPKERTLTVGIVALKNSGESASSPALMLSGTTISLLPVIVVYIVCNRYFVSGLSAGAVKG